ncbi:MAG: DsrE family protein [Betaproteobacteria bacterium]|nr:DsrE family protein [Betaproteobacteria bacterium]
MKTGISRILLTLAFSSLALCSVSAQADDDSFAPGGTAIDHHDERYPNLKVVMDLKVRIPADVSFGVATARRIISYPNAKLVVVIEGPSVAIFAKKNYLDHQGMVDQWADLANKGVQVEFCGNSVHGAGLKPADMDGLSDKNPAVVNPGALPSIAHYEQMGYALVIPSPQEQPAS